MMIGEVKVNDSDGVHLRQDDQKLEMILSTHLQMILPSFGSRERGAVFPCPSAEKR